MKLRNLALAVAVSLPLSGACGTAPAFAVGSLADVSIVDRTTGRALPTWFSDGRWYVAGRPGSNYEIRIRNQAGTDLLAVTSVDGVNVVSGETAAVSQTGYVLSPGSLLPIRGWRKDMARVAAFTFTSLDDSYAARTGRPDDVGVIGVAVFRRKPEPMPAPILEDRLSGPASGAARDDRRARSSDNAQGAAAPSARADAAPMEKSLGTGHGRIESAPVRYTSFERESATPNEVITLWYDSRANLVARGIIAATPLPACDPRPFPAGFVPDPPAR